MQELYASRGRDYLVVWPAPAAMHGQSSCYNKCLEEFRSVRRATLRRRPYHRYCIKQHVEDAHMRWSVMALSRKHDDASV
jgi:hypothetical protein